MAKVEIPVQVTIPVEDVVEYLKKDGTLVKVVRCKDCKYHEDEEIGMVYCPRQVGGWVKDDWFCADGERRDPCSSQDS